MHAASIAVFQEATKVQSLPHGPCMRSIKHNKEKLHWQICTITGSPLSQPPVTLHVPRALRGTLLQLLQSSSDGSVVTRHRVDSAYAA